MLERWLKFNAVGLMGIVLQLAVLFTLVNVLKAHYLMATFLAVETAILHNFAWHEQWTWRDRASPGRQGMPARLLRFHVANGGVSMAGNLVLMGLFVGALGLPAIVANLAAILICSCLNFLLSHFWVFD